MAAFVARCGALGAPPGLRGALRCWAAEGRGRIIGGSGLRCAATAAAARIHVAAAANGVSGGADRPAWRQVRRLSSGRVVTQSVKDFGAESIKEGSLMEFKKKVGDPVEKGEVIASIETDKVTVDVNAEESGVLKELLAKPDDTITVGQGLFTIEVGAAGAPAAAASPAAPAAEKPAAAAAVAAASPGRIVEQAIKDFGAESITEGTLMEWRKKVGEAVSKGDILAVIETDKVSIELAAEEGGVVKEILVQPDETVIVGKVLVKIEAGATAAAAAAVPAAEASTPTAAAAAAPAAAAAADLTGIRAGFARAAAARAAGWPAPGAAAAAGAPKAAPAAAVAPPAATSVGEGRTERRVPMSGVRRRVATRLKEAQNTLALLTTFQEADLSASLDIRNKHKDLFQKTHGAQLGLLSFIVKASATGLMDIPGVNAVIDDAASQVVYRDYVDMAVPIPSPRGPVTCTLRGVEKMSIREIEGQLSQLADKARKDALSLDDLSPASFGIADSGIAGGMLGTCFVNPPASAMLGTNAVKQRASVVGGKVVARPMMYLSLTYDHRLVDGREAATFLVSVRDKLEDPSRLLLDL